MDKFEAALAFAMVCVGLAALALTGWIIFGAVTGTLTP